MLWFLLGIAYVVVGVALGVKFEDSPYSIHVGAAYFGLPLVLVPLIFVGIWIWQAFGWGV